MPSFLFPPFQSLVTLGLMTLTTAQAAQLDLSVTQPLSARLGLSDLQAFGSRWGAGVLVQGSTFGADISVTQGLALPPLGAVNVTSRAQGAWGGGRAGWHWDTRVTGAAGPLALNLGLGRFTTPATTFDPLAGWTLAATDPRNAGWHGDLSGRYRLSRTLVGVAGAEWGGQNLYALGVESRRDLTRPLPPTEGDDDAAPPETERIGTLTYRAGLRAGRDLLGLTGGVTYATESGKTLALDVQLGAKLGAVASLGWPDAWGEGSTLNVYAAYEPWREAGTLAYPAIVRLGVEGSRPVGRGTLNVALRGGKTAAGKVGMGLSVGYSLPLGQEKGGS